MALCLVCLVLRGVQAARDVVQFWIARWELAEFGGPSVQAYVLASMITAQRGFRSVRAQRNR